MEPGALLELAGILCEMNGPAARRAAISRSYYFVFHHLKLWLNGVGVDIREDPGGHQDVIEALHQSKHPLLRSISSKCD